MVRATGLPRLKLPFATQRSAAEASAALESNSNSKVELLLSVSAPVEMDWTLAPGDAVLPALKVTAELTVPVPPKVALLFTVTPEVPVSEPLMRSVPAFTVVAPV